VVERAAEMPKIVEKVDPYGELIDLAVQLVQDLAMTQAAFWASGDLPVEKTKEFSHAIDLAARILEKTLALAKANWRRGQTSRKK
jgi:hypothetical protein